MGARSLASYWVCTPDPQLIDPPSGQKLVLLWRFSPAQWVALVAPKLHLRVRLANREEKSLWWDIDSYNGKVVFSNIGSSECPVSAINTYRAEIVTEGKVVYFVEQALWTEWIALQGADDRQESMLDPFQTPAIQNETPLRVEERCDEEKGGYVWDDLEEIS